jgi:hypothetical protein
MEKEATGTYNICTGEVRTMEEIAKTIQAQIEWIPRREYEVERHEGDPAKIKLMGWSPKVDVVRWLERQV